MKKRAERSFFFSMAEKEGFEPSHAFTSAGFRNRSLQPLGYFSNRAKKIIPTIRKKVIEFVKMKAMKQI